MNKFNFLFLLKNKIWNTNKFGYRIKKIKDNYYSSLKINLMKLL